jgi:hypothetical protein
MSFSRKSLLAATGAVALGTAAIAQAGLVYELRVLTAPAATTGTFTDTQHNRLAVAGTYQVGLFAKVTGANVDTLYDGYQFGYFSVTSAETGSGAFGGTNTSGISSASRFAGTPYTAPDAAGPVTVGAFNGAGTRNGGSGDLTTDGARDWGSNATDLTDTSYMLARSSATTFGDMYLDNPFVDNDFDGLPDAGRDGSAEPGNGTVITGGREYRLAQFNITVLGTDLPSGGGTTTYKVVKPNATQNGGTGAVYTTFYPDDTLTNIDGSNAATVYNGSIGFTLVNNNVVPEPATLGLLGAAAVGLLGRRRK